MRKIEILFLLLCTAFAGRAQDGEYKPMLVDGRTWVCAAVVLREHSKEVTDCDTIFNSYTYTKVDMPFLAEEGKQLYLHVDGEKEIQFDFGLNEGDYFRGDRVKCVDTIEVKGKRYRRLSFESINNYWWVEGIGSNLYGFLNGLDLLIMPIGQYDYGIPIDYYLEAVYDGDECIFERQDFSRPAVTAIKDIETVSPSKNALYDLQGRHLSTKPAKGVYIENGKKWVVK